jgi:hypothetical protein
MSASRSITVDAQAWTHLNYLEEGGFSVLLWDTLKDFGYTAYPEYQLLRWEVKVKIPVCPTHPTWEEWEVKAQGLNLADIVQKAALEAFTTFCEKHADLVASTAVLTVYFGTPNMFITLWFGFDYGTNPPLGTLII